MILSLQQSLACYALDPFHVIDARIVDVSTTFVTMALWINESINKNF